MPNGQAEVHARKEMHTATGPAQADRRLPTVKQASLKNTFGRGLRTRDVIIDEVGHRVQRARRVQEINPPVAARHDALICDTRRSARQTACLGPQRARGGAQKGDEGDPQLPAGEALEGDDAPGGVQCRRVNHPLKIVQPSRTPWVQSIQVYS